MEKISAKKSGKFTKSPLTLAFHNAAKFRMLRQKFLCIIGNLRSAKPDWHIRTQLSDFKHNFFYIVQIPDIAGKAENIRLSLIDVHQDIVFLLVDRILSDLHRRIPGIGFQAVDRQIGMYIFCIDCCQ
mgnify:CR=1 FL=1